MTYRSGIIAFLLLGFQSIDHPVRDPLFPGVEKFERNAVSVVRVESDRNHQEARPAGDPPRFSNVYVFKYERAGQYNAGDVEPYRRKLHTPEWTCKVCPESLKTGEVRDTCTRPVGSSAVESAVIDTTPLTVTFVHSVGAHSGEYQSNCDND